jgi:hypothetical protein
MTCGATKLYDRLVLPLVCNLPAGHTGPHGVSVNGTTPFVRWSDTK